jgi:glycosyltransferase involved in cell wall biosynthesis
MQYLACEKPVVATNLPGIRDILPDEMHGVVFSENTNELVRNTLELLENKERAEEIGMNGYKYVKENHDWDMIARKFEGILEEQVDKRKAHDL